MQWIEFAGEGRSGHTIVSAILGSHPHIRIGEEQKYISKWWRDKEAWPKETIIAHLLQSGIGKERRELGFDEYQITRQDKDFKLFGDKCGWAAVNEVRKREAPLNILDLFGEHMAMPIKVVVTVRHPLDNISAWVTSPKYKRIYVDDNLRFRRMIRRYKRFHDSLQPLLANQDTYLLHNERLIADPSTVMQELETWLGLERNKDWRRYCAPKVRSTPHRRRDTVTWPEEYVERVMTYINECPLLEYYRES